MVSGRTTAYNFAGVNALIVGLAREGTAMARFLAQHGARVTVTDLKTAGALREAVNTLQEWPITYALGSHPPSLLDRADIVFVSPGVPCEIPLLIEAGRRRIPLSSETRLFAQLCPALIVGITGSSGKSTTTELVGAILSMSGLETWIGGNIGRPLIEHLKDIAPSNVVIMELSSFQLAFFAAWPADCGDAQKGRGQAGLLFEPCGVSPRVAAILNITPNHLDRHSTMEAYIEAKNQILAYQRPGSVAVLNMDDPNTLEIGREPEPGRQVVWFSLDRETELGAFRRGDGLWLRWAGREQLICNRGELELLGEHNVANALAAFALAAAAGAPVEAIRQVAVSFRGVKHRLEMVMERDSVRWYNDSIATTPERTVAALRSFDDPILLLAGGRDKHLPWRNLADLAWQKVRHLILFGEAADLVEEAMHRSQLATDGVCQIHQAGTLERAVKLAAALARHGDIVLLSPGGTSYDAYQDFAERGEHFRSLVAALE